MKQYVTDVIGDEYKEWNHGKIVISTPCASGKTTFILQVLLPYYYKMGKKVLMICNRRALKAQYKNGLYANCESYEETETIEFDTYQNMGDSCYAKSRLPDKYYKYDVFCFDEVHCLAEEDYNKTYHNLFQVICNTLRHKTLIFMSATLDRMEKYLIQYKKQFGFIVRYGNQCIEIPSHLPSEELFFWYNNIPADYSYIEMIGIRDEQQLCACIFKDVMGSKGQVLVFSEKKAQLSALSKKLTDESGLKKRQIMEVNSTKMNDGTLDAEKEEMLNAERFPEGIDVILTTKVLDNGITLRSDGLFSICALTANKTEFIQMISRLRVVPGQKVKLYVMEVDVKLYAERIQKINKCIKIAEDFKSQGISAVKFDMIQADENLRKLVYSESNKKLWIREISLNGPSSSEHGMLATYRINPFVLDKMRDELFFLKKIQAEGYNNPQILAEAQAQWLGLDKDSIKWLELDPIKEQIKEILLHKLDGVGSEEYRKVVKEVSALCWNDVDLKKYIERKGASMCNEKFEQLCEMLQLRFCTEQQKETRKKVYKVVERQK